MNKSIYKGHPISNNLHNLKNSEGIVEGFTLNNSFDPKIEAITKLGITDWEQLYSLLSNKAIEECVNTALDIHDNDELKSLRKITESSLPKIQKRKLDEIEITNCPLGARKPITTLKTFEEKFVQPDYKELENLIESDRKIYQVQEFDRIKDFELASSVNHIHELSSIRGQGSVRGTCTSFAVTSANEFSIYKRTGKYYDLSEQHLFFETKVYEGDSECGSWVKSSMEIISNKGQCLESVWSYNPQPPCIQNNGKPTNADSNGRQFKNTYFIINPNDILALKQTLSSGKIIAFSIPVYDSWYHSAESYRTGRITLPLPGEQGTGGHAMAMVGYQDDNSSPGGGYFIIRNSWGTDWAKENYYGKGYGVIPYSYIANYNWEAFSF